MDVGGWVVSGRWVVLGGVGGGLDSLAGGLGWVGCGRVV